MDTGLGLVFVESNLKRHAVYPMRLNLNMSFSLI